MSDTKTWWILIRSMKTGLILVFMVVIVSIMGTFVPQNAPSGPLGRVYAILQLNDWFHAWWYTTLLALAGLNLAACSFQRLKTVRGRLRQSEKLLEAQQFSILQQHDSFVLMGTPVDIGNRAMQYLNQKGYEVWFDQGGGMYRIGAQYGRYSVLGSLMTHFSFLLVIVGVLWGAALGYQGSISAPVGSTFVLQDIAGIHDRAASYDFQVHIDDFWIEHYPDGSPSGYYSRVSIIENGAIVRTEVIAVNQPLMHRGIKFYQTSWGNALEVQLQNANGLVIQKQTVPEGQHIALAGTDLSMVIYRPRPSSHDNPMSPLRYMLFRDDTLVATGEADWSDPISLNSQGSSIQIIGAIPYTGLHMKKDPGVPVIWLGCVGLVLGMTLSFFMRPHRLWMVIQPRDKQAVVELGGLAKGNPLMLEEITGRLRKALQTDQVSIKGLNEGRT